MTDAPEAAEETTEEAPPQAAPAEKPAKKPWWERHYTFFGTAVGLVFLWFSQRVFAKAQGNFAQEL